MKKRGFTLFELLLIFVIIGIIVLIMLQTIKKIMPDENKARVKKAYNTITNVVESLTNDNDAYYEGLLNKNGNGSNVAETYFCQQFADKINTMGDISCNENSGVTNQAVTSYTDLDGRCTKRADGPFAFKTSDGINWYGMYDAFATQTLDGNGIDTRYVVVCVDTEPKNSNANKTVFAFGVRRDGRIIIGQKAQAILDEDKITK